MSQHLDAMDVDQNMSLEQMELWIAALTPAEGKLVQFNGVYLVDIDLRLYFENAIAKRKSAIHKQVMNKNVVDATVQNVFDHTHPYID